MAMAEMEIYMPAFSIHPCLYKEDEKYSVVIIKNNLLVTIYLCAGAALKYKNEN